MTRDFSPTTTHRVKSTTEHTKISVIQQVSQKKGLRHPFHAFLTGLADAAPEMASEQVRQMSG